VSNTNGAEGQVPAIKATGSDEPAERAGPPAAERAGPPAAAAERADQVAAAAERAGPPAAERADHVPGAERAGPPAAGAERRDRPRQARRRRFSWRTLVAALLLILGCVLAPVSVLAVWTANQVSDTGRYVANIAPLIKDPAIQNALTDKLTNEIVTQINVKGLTDQVAAELSQKGLPRIGGLLQSVAGSLASGVQGFVHSRIHKIITGPRMTAAWTQVNQAAHQALVAALSGRGGGTGAIAVSNGQVTLDVAPLEAVAKQDLAARGLTAVNKIPTVHATFPLFPSKNLVKAQRAYRLINDLKIVLPIVTLVLLIAGVWVAPGHRRALIGAGLGFAASMLVLGVGLAIARVIYLRSVPASVLPADAAAAAFDILVRFIRTALRTLLVVGLIVAIGAFFTGPSTAAVGTRSAVSAGLRRIRHGGESAGLSTGPVGRWTYTHRRALRIGAAALAALVFVFWGRPTAVVTIMIAAALLLVLGLIELIGRPPAQPGPAFHAQER
jgi:hypothetical protein